MSSKNFQVCVSTPLAPASDYEMMLQSAQDGDGNTKFALASDDASKYIIQMGKVSEL